MVSDVSRIIKLCERLQRTLPEKPVALPEKGKSSEVKWEESSLNFSV